MLLQSSFYQRIHFDVIQITFLMLVYYRVVVRHVRIRLVTHLVFLAYFDLGFQLLRQFIHNLLLVLIREEYFLAVTVRI